MRSSQKDMHITEQLDLMHRSIDGDATAEEQRRLEELLASSPEARETFSGLQDVARRLDAVPLVEPPPLRDDVMAAIARNQPATPAAFARGARQRRYLAFAYAAAAVIIIAIAVQHAPPPSQRAGATMMRTDTTELPVLARAKSASGELTIRERGDEVIVEGTSAAAGPMTIEWDAAKFLPSAGSATFGASPARIRLQRRPNSTGACVIRLRLPGHSSVQATVELH